jgi:hypothetical protein
MTLERVAGTTVLTGEVVDQARLHGFIDRLGELGLELLEVRRFAHPGAAESNGGSL